MISCYRKRREKTKKQKKNKKQKTGRCGDYPTVIEPQVAVAAVIVLTSSLDSPTLFHLRVPMAWRLTCVFFSLALRIDRGRT
jgi:hypothetical protein